MSDRKAQLERDIADARQEVAALLADRGPEQLERATANPDWKVRDIVAHLATIESRLRSMWRHALDGRAWPADDASIDAYNERCVAERRGWTTNAVLDEFTSSGQETSQALAELTEADLDTSWSHPTRGPVTVEFLAQIIPRHLRAHGEELRSALEG